MQAVSQQLTHGFRLKVVGGKNTEVWSTPIARGVHNEHGTNTSPTQFINNVFNRRKAKI